MIRFIVGVILPLMLLSCDSGSALNQPVRPGSDESDAISEYSPPLDPRIEALRHDLASDDARTREEAALKLGRFDVAAAPLLVTMLHDKEFSVQWEAQSALWRIGEAAIPALLDGLVSDDVWIRGSAAETLAEFGKGAQDAVPLLREQICDPDHLMHDEAVAALARIAPGTPGIARDLLLAIRDSEHWEDASRDALEAVRKHLVPGLIEILTGSDADLREPAAWELIEAGEATAAHADALVRALVAEDPAIRRWAAVVLALTAPAHGDTVSVLQEMLGSTKPSEQSAAIWALAALGPRARGAAHQVLKLMESDAVEGGFSSAINAVRPLETPAEDAVPVLLKLVARPGLSTCRASAAMVLAEYGEDARAAVPVLIAALTEEWEARGRSGWPVKHQGHDWAARALGRLGPVAADAVPALAIAYREGDRWLSRTAGYALADIGAPAVPALIKLLDEAPKERRDGVLRALGKIGKAAGPAVAAVEKFKDDPALSVRSTLILARLDPDSPRRYEAFAEALWSAEEREVARVLYDLEPGDARLLPTIHRCLCHPAPRVRLAAVDANLRITGEIGVGLSTLLDLLEHERPMVHVPAAATLALAREALDRVLPVLRRVLAEDGPAREQRLAISALGSLGPDAAPAVLELLGILARDPYGHEKQAIAALARIGPAAEKAIPMLEYATGDRDPSVRRAAHEALRAICGER